MSLNCSSCPECYENITITVQTGLAFQANDFIQLYDGANAYIYGSIVSYDPITGVTILTPCQYCGETGSITGWTISLSGIPGVAGSSGTSGTSGTSATSGTSGTSGSDGTSGTTGTSGTSGTDGTSGTSGTSGTDGTSGTSGGTGSSGSAGSSGTSGTSGGTGSSGSAGSSGTSGTSGTSGSSGTAGTAGSPGTSGSSGTSGTSGLTPDPNARNETTFTATAGQTVFSVTYNVGQVDVYYNGSKLSPAEFTAINGTSITLATPCLVGDIVNIVAYVTGVTGTSGTAGTSGTSGTTGTSGTSGITPANQITGTGTTNFLPKFTATSTIGDSLFYDNGTLTAVGNRVSTNSFVGLVRNFNVLGTDAAVRVARYTDSYATLHPTVELLNYSDDGVYRRFYWDYFVDGNDSFGIRQRLTGGGVATSGTVIDQIRLMIFSGGNVGIGTTTDAGYKLDVSGTTRLGALTGATAVFTNSGAGIGIDVTNSGSGDGIKITHLLGRAFRIESSSTGFGIIINNETASTSAPFTIQKQGLNVITMSDTGAANFTGQLTLGSTITNGANTYTLPSATGTLALTSALSSYLPLSGGTLTGALTGTSASFSSTVTASAFIPSGASVPTNGMYLSAANTLDFATNSTNRLSITSGGNVGIGTTDPQTILNGFSGSARGVAISNALPTIALKDTNGGTFYLGSDSSEAYLWNEGNGIMAFATNNAERMRITSGGNVEVRSAGKLIAYRSDNARYGEFYTDNLAVHLTSSTDPLRISSVDRTEFYNAGSERMRITSGGNVGIGTASPAYKLNLVGGSEVGSRFIVSGTYAPIQFSGDNSTTIGGINAFAGNVVIGRGTSTGVLSDLVISSSGVVQIANLAGVGSRTVTADASGNLSAASDARLKQEDLDYKIEGLAEILQLQPKAYKWLSDIENRGENASTEIGFFANDVATIIPSAAPMGNDGYYGFYDRAVIAALVNSVKELKAEIDILKNN